MHQHLGHMLGGSETQLEGEGEMRGRGSRCTRRWLRFGSADSPAALKWGGEYAVWVIFIRRI